jgi:hypothetical protein
MVSIILAIGIHNFISVSFLEELVANPLPVERLALAAYQHALKYYSWSAKAQKTLEFYAWVTKHEEKPNFWESSDA